MQFRAEFFNFLNHTNLANPSGRLFSGVVTDTAYSEEPLASAGLITATLPPNPVGFKGDLVDGHIN